MARNNATKTIVEEAVKTIEPISDTVEEMDEDTKKNTKKSIYTEPLKDSDEIEVISLIANVSYKDSKTFDMYEWSDIGHSEYMTFETLKNMWRNNKGYFKNLWLKPMDNRVINQFGLAKTFEKYEYLMDGSNYTRKNINEICEAIKETPNGLKISICDKVKNLVISGDVADIHVIKELEKRLGIDLVEFLD